MSRGKTRMSDDRVRKNSSRIPQKSLIHALKESFAQHLSNSLGQDQYTVTRLGQYSSLGFTVRDRLIQRWLRTQQHYYNVDAKRVYYLSLEFLLGRMLGNHLINLQLLDESAQALRELGVRLEDLREVEWDAALGNGGLGRLAACFLDSMATMRRLWSTTALVSAAETSSSFLPSAASCRTNSPTFASISASLYTRASCSM